MSGAKHEQSLRWSRKFFSDTRHMILKIPVYAAIKASMIYCSTCMKLGKALLKCHLISVLHRILHQASKNWWQFSNTHNYAINPKGCLATAAKRSLVQTSAGFAVRVMRCWSFFTQEDKVKRITSSVIISMRFVMPIPSRASRKPHNNLS